MRPLSILFFLVGLVPLPLSALEIYLTRPIVDGATAQTFGDICVSPQSADPEVAQALAAPLPALATEPALIPTREVKGLLSRYLTKSFVLVGARFIYLPKNIHDPDRRAFDAAFLSYLDRAVRDKSVRVAVSIPSGESFAGLGSASGQLQFQLPAGSSTPQELAQNQFVQYSTPDSFGFQTVPIKIEAYGPVSFARQSIASGQPVTPGDVATQDVDLSTLSGAPVRVSRAELTAREQIPAGSPILAGMVERDYAVRVGQAVTVTLRRGAVSVSLPGRAFASGSVGDSIEVGIGNMSHRFSGEVASPTEVIVNDN